jgi:hypothetical protein
MSSFRQKQEVVEYVKEVANIYGIHIRALSFTI